MRPVNSSKNKRNNKISWPFKLENNTTSGTKGNPKNPKLKSKAQTKRLLAKPIPKYFTFLHPFDAVGVVETKSVD